MATSWRPSRRSLLQAGAVTAAGLAAGGLAGCSGNSLDSRGGGGTRDDGGGGGGPANMQFMFWGSTEERKAVSDMLSAFKQEKPDVTIKPLYTPADYDTKLNALVASNRAPDLCYMGAGLGYRLAEQGKLVDLFPYFDKYPDLANRLPGTYFWWDENKTFGTQSANESMQLFYSKGAFDEAGVEYPPAAADQAWSWDDFVQNAYRLTLDHEGRHPDESGFDPKKIRQYGVSTGWWHGTWYPLLLSRGVDLTDEAGTKTMIDSTEAIGVFQDLADLMYVHRVAPTPTQLGNNAPSTTVQLKTRRMAMVIDGQWTLLDLSRGELDFGIGVLPSYGTPMTTTMGGATAIFASTKHLEEAVEFYLFHANPEKVDLFANGLWMPLETKYYTDQAAIDLWTKNEAHPPEYRSAVIDYTVNHSQVTCYQRLRNIDAIDKVLTPALQVVQQGKQPAAEVLRPLAQKLNGGLLKGRYPSGPA